MIIGLVSIFLFPLFIGWIYTRWENPELYDQYEYISRINFKYKK